jgi:DNA-binding NtrC family response regulator
VLDVAARLADAPATLLITGESGTGKSLVAREIHHASRRRDAAFVEVACGCLSETLLESELFGHTAGAFTGATGDRVGKFLQADGGTIFLDEIATASPALQVKLLRVLQDRRFEAVGSTRTHAVDARVILATNEDLSALVAAGRFRADLFWRVNVITIEMPPLRERQEDIVVLARHFLALLAARGGRRVAGFSPESIEVLSRHRWPGNVRELEHAVEHAALLGSGDRIEVVDLPMTVRRGDATPVAAGAAGAVSDGSASPLKRSLADPERRLILDALERHGWRRGDAARALGINRTTLYKKLKRLGMSLTDLAPACR